MLLNSIQTNSIKRNNILSSTISNPLIAHAAFVPLIYTINWVYEVVANNVRVCELPKQK